jgi:hypothetical protein
MTGAEVDEVIAVIGVIVLLSVPAHGFSAGLLATWFGEEQSRDAPPTHDPS